MQLKKLLHHIVQNRHTHCFMHFVCFLKYHTSPRGVFDISNLLYKLIMEYAFLYSLISNSIQNGPLAIFYERKNVWT